MSITKIDFAGFTFNSKHSSEFNILRVSDGSRYNENLLPEPSDITTERSGANGTYFFGSVFKNRTISVQIAYNNMSETDLHNLRIWLGDNQIHQLIFDELPYKVYDAKTKSVPILNYICFDELIGSTTERRYKGEGNIDFIIYEPYSYTPYTNATISKTSVISGNTINIKYRNYAKFLNNALYTSCANINEWSASNGMYATAAEGSITIDSPVTSGSMTYIDLYNPGDCAVPFKLYLQRCALSGAGDIINLTGIKLFASRSSSGTPIGQLITNFSTTEAIKRTYTSEYFVLNSNNRLIEGYNSSNTKTGEILNSYITSGDFFMIPQGQSRLCLYGVSNTYIMLEYPYYYL